MEARHAFSGVRGEGWLGKEETGDRLTGYYNQEDGEDGEDQRETL